jgi:site-specific recombinase XerD
VVLVDDLDLEAELPNFEVALRAERKSAATIDSYLRGVRGFLRWCTTNGHTGALDRELVRGFTADLLDDGAEPATAASRQHAVRRFSAWLTDEGLLAEDPLLGLRAPRIDVKVVESLEEGELARLIKACEGTAFRDRRDMAMVRLLAETGMRAGEAMGLRTTDVDVRDGIVIIRKAKNGRGRTVSFGPQTAVAITRYLRMRRNHRLAGTDVLWLGERGMGLSYQGLRKTMGRRGEQAGLPGFHAHLLRHTAASRWLAAGGSEQGLMTRAGWRSRQMLDRYTAHNASARATEEAKRLNLGDL